MVAIVEWNSGLLCRRGWRLDSMRTETRWGLVDHPVEVGGHCQPDVSLETSSKIPTCIRSRYLIDISPVNTLPADFSYSASEFEFHFGSSAENQGTAFGGPWCGCLCWFAECKHRSKLYLSFGINSVDVHDACGIWRCWEALNQN